MKKFILLACVVMAIAMVPVTADAASVFTDDFESGLGQWTGKGGGTHHGQIVADPLNPGNSVLNFTSVISAGDIFQSPGLTTTPGQELILSFDYLGTGSGQSGGYIGISGPTDSQHFWLAGTGSVSNAAPILNTTGQWQHVEIAFDTRYTTSRVMIEDFVAPAFNAYFDNVRLASAVPVPAALVAGPALMGLIALRRRR